MTERDDDKPGESTAKRPTPSPKAQAASRARRIGGRPQPGAAPRPTAAVAPKPAPTESEVTPEPVPSASRPPLPVWLNWLPAAVLGAVIVLVLVLGLVASHGVWWAKKSTDTAGLRQQVLASAKGCMAKINTYDYRKLDASEAAGVACTTGDLTAQYKTTMEKLIKPQAPKVKFTQAATINSAGIESISKDGKQWVVLIFGQLSTTNSQDGTTTPKLSIFSAQATMERVHGTWLISAYQYAPRT
jgi:hypothetical protein